MYDHLQLLALKSVVLPDDEYAYRNICRWYSKEFHTPLHQVYDLPWVMVLINYYESMYEKLPKSSLYDMVIEKAMPDLAQQEEDDFEEWAQNLEKKEQEKNKHLAEEKAKTEVKNPPNPPLPDVIKSYE